MVLFFLYCMNFSSNVSDGLTRPAKRSKKLSSNDNIAELNNEQISSQIEMNEYVENFFSYNENFTFFC